MPAIKTYNAVVEVYIEYVILDNAVINTIIIRLTLAVTHQKIRAWRVALASLLGTAFSVVFPFIDINNFFLLLLIKTLCALIMVFTFSGRISLKKYISAVLWFFGFTFLTGGVCMGLLLLCGGSLADVVSFSYISQIPIGAVAGMLFFSLYYAFRAAKHLIRYKNIAPFSRRIELTLGGVSVELNGIIDSGNMLYSPKDNRPVILAVDSEKLDPVFGRGEGKGAAEMLDKGYLDALDKGVLDQLLKINTVKPCGKMKFFTAAGSKEIDLYEAEKLKIYSAKGANIIYDVIIGLVDRGTRGGDIDLLIHPAFI